MTPERNPGRYSRRKAYFDRFLTLYGRKPVLEALRNERVHCARLHLASSNRPDATIDEIVALAESCGAEILQHERRELARISRNGRQDQGVAADISWDGYQELDAFLCCSHGPDEGPLIALDRIHNPQNLGMLIRAVTAGCCQGLLLPRSGGCDVDPLAIKSSAGSLFRATLLRCQTIEDGLVACRKAGYEICVLDAAARQSLLEFRSSNPVVMILGNETDGVSQRVRDMADSAVSIPLANGVESLNVAMAGVVVAFSRFSGQ